ncbi:hypothetical protein [Marinobacterium sp. BA1]|uniref:hypothetical protein n=1 Tax=Marinobacterium sp. BA1 TaxID=3138931 RepID=UPI0032E78691
MKSNKIHIRLITIRVLATLSLLFGVVMVYFRDSAGWEPLSGSVVGACVMSASAAAWLATMDFEGITGLGVFFAFFPMAAFVFASMDSGFIGGVSVVVSSAFCGYAVYRLMREPLEAVNFI